MTDYERRPIPPVTLLTPDGVPVQPSELPHRSAALLVFADATPDCLEAEAHQPMAACRLDAQASQRRL